MTILHGCMKVIILLCQVVTQHGGSAASMLHALDPLYHDQ